jgi:hypothetical protein
MDKVKIFVQIASYRDPELPKTIKSAIVNAKYPTRLTFGIVNQFDEASIIQAEQLKKFPNIKIMELPWQQSKGVGEARYMCGKLYSSEDFSIQIDSHSRFGRHWDEVLIKEWLLCEDPRAILSAYPPEYKYNDNGEEEFSKYQTSSVYVKDLYQSIPKLKSKQIASQNKPVEGIFAVGGFQFMPGEVCQQVPYIREIWFFGEEAARSFQLYNRGYNVYIPNNLPVFHQYHRVKVGGHYLWDDMKGDLKNIYDSGTGFGYRVARAVVLGDTNSKYIDPKGRKLNKLYELAGLELIDGELKLK